MCPTCSLEDRHSSRSPRRKPWLQGPDGWVGPRLQSSCKMPAFPGCPFPFRSGRCLCRVRLWERWGLRRLEGERFQAGGWAVGARGGWREGGRASPISEEALQGPDVKEGRVKAGCSPSFCGVGPPLFLSRLPPPLPAGRLRMGRVSPGG
uniref:Uncharacterized protein n=1 Tax=Pipistrellus kuhlii TaxID=59472 RepID=A0A7J7TW18_PIPKU|nr:hypothetical protein mPipKuh1_009242 [Pipistrellus kuhlii]